MTTPRTAQPQRRRALDRRGLTLFLERTEGVLHVDDLARFGVDGQAVRRGIGPGGRWWMPYPGVLVTSRRPTRRQRLTAAVLYAGAGAMVTGLDALWLAGVDGLDELASLGRRPRPRCPDRACGAAANRPVLLVPGRRRVRLSALEIEGGARLPRPCRAGRLAYAPPARAAIDAVRRTTNPDVARLVLAMVVWGGLCDLHELSVELGPGESTRDHFARQMLDELVDDPARAAIARLEALLARHGVDAPAWDTPVRAGRGTLLFPDAVWPRSGVALWLGARHADPAQERLRRRRLRRDITGLTVLTAEPREVFDTPGRVFDRIRDALNAAVGRPVPVLRLVRRPPSVHAARPRGDTGPAGPAGSAARGTAPTGLARAIA